MTHGIDVPEFRTKARAWLEGNLERRPQDAHGQRPRGFQARTAEGMAAERALQRVLFDGGYAGISVPVEYGGRGLSPEHERAFVEESAGFRLPDFGVMTKTTFSVCCRTMLAHGSRSLLARHIPALLAGEELWVQMFSEPDAGSDLAAVRTRAVRDGNGWRLNGSKIWTSGASFADFGMCLARTSWDVPKHRGLTWFAVPLAAPGVTIRPIREINGDEEFCEEFFDDVVLADDDVIGEVNDGWTVAQTMLAHERSRGGGNPYRISEPLQFAPDLVALARRAGRDTDPIARQAIARAHVNDVAFCQLLLRIETRAQRANNRPEAAYAAYGKLANGVLTAARARAVMDVGGSTALLYEQGDTEQMLPSLTFLNGRIMAIGAGTNEMQRNAIGERVLGLPREPTFDTSIPFKDVLANARNWSGKVG